MTASLELKNFQDRCHHYFTCFTFAAIGLESAAEKFSVDSVGHEERSLFIGTGHPDLGNTHSKVKIRDAILASRKDGTYSSDIAKSIIVSIYSEWDEVYRHSIAREIGTDARSIASDLMGDLRHVRNCIVHNKSVVNYDCLTFKELGWHLSQGCELLVTRKMLSSLVDCINVMAVSVHAV